MENHQKFPENKKSFQDYGQNTNDHFAAIIADQDYDQLLEMMQPMIRFVIQKSVHDCYTSGYYEDLKQEALMAVVTCSKSWDKDGGMSFPSWAYLYIRRAVTRARSKQVAYDTNNMSQGWDICDEEDGYNEYVTDDGYHLAATELEVDFDSYLDWMSPRDAEIVSALAHGYTQTEVADKFGLSQSRVCRIVNTAAKRIKEELGDE